MILRCLNASWNAPTSPRPLKLGDSRLFAPTDAAFAAINFDPEALDTQQLENILRYHILPSAFRPASSIPNGQLYLETANGDSPNGAAVALFLEKDGDQIILNNQAEVTRGGSSRRVTG
jgi:uncharacterized surface protein with fasciclin (FAS1) repeats